MGPMIIALWVLVTRILLTERSKGHHSYAIILRGVVILAFAKLCVCLTSSCLSTSSVYELFQAIPCLQSITSNEVATLPTRLLRNLYATNFHLFPSDRF